MNNNVIELKNIYKSFDIDGTLFHANKDISLTIKKGELVSIIGASGSGKSTLMNTIGCLSTPTSGEYILNGVSVNKMDETDLTTIRNKEIGFIFQQYNLIGKLNVRENIELPLLYKKEKKSVRDEVVDSLIDKMGLRNKENKYPNKLSGGEQQRVSIARALANDPSIILADEPTGALDSKTGEMILDLICDLNKNGKTVIIVTHDINVAKRCNRIITIKDGVIVDDVDNSKNVVKKRKNEQEVKLVEVKEKKKRPRRKKKEEGVLIESYSNGKELKKRKPRTKKIDK